MNRLFTPLALLTFSSCGLSDLCSNEIIKEVHSPDKQLKAVIFSRDCGATTGESRQLSILKANQELANEGGNTFVIDYGNAPEPLTLKFSVEWNNNKQLTVYFDSLARTFEMKDKIEGIEVKYRHVQ